MEDEGPLLQLFDKAGLLPSITYTEDSICQHKRKVSKYLARRSPFEFKIREDEEEITHAYALNSFTDAIDRIRRIIRRDDLAFYPVSELWQSHWNPSAPDEEWEKPMLEWNESLTTFNYNRLKMTHQIIEASKQEHYDRVLQTKTQADINALEEELVECQSHSDTLTEAVHIRDDMISGFQRDSLRYRDQRNLCRDQINDMEVEMTQLSNTCYKLQTECNRLQLELDRVKAAEEQRQRTIKEIDNTEDLADLSKKSKHLLLLRKEYEGFSKDRRQRKERLRIDMDRSCKKLERGIENEKKAEGFLSVLEEETRVYGEMDIDGNGEGSGNEVSYMNSTTEIGSNNDVDSLGDIPCPSPQGGKPRSRTQPGPTRKKKDSGRSRVKLGHINNWDKETGIVEKAEVWAGIDVGGKLYRRCTPLGKDRKSGKTSVKHSEIEYLLEFQNLAQDAVDALIKAKLAAALQAEEDG